MTDWRALCEELVEALDGWHQAVFETGIGWVRPDETYLIDRARAALLTEEPALADSGGPAADTDQILRLAAIIREVDGSHTKGAAALAESILTHPGFRAALADEPAVPEGRDPVAVTGQPSDEELLATLDHATASFPPRHPDAEALNAVEYPLALELRKARAVLARWGNPAPVPPADGEMAKLVAKLRRLAPQNPLGTADPTITRAADLLSEDDARAALSQPVPEVVEPSLEEVEDLCEEHCFNVRGYESIECLQELINDALARWGRPAPPAEGEVGELVSVLRLIRLDVPPCDGAKISRAADLLSIAYATGPEV